MSKTLIVPIKLQAMVLNDKCLEGDKNFQRWSMQYGNLSMGGSAEPSAFNDIDTGFTSSENIDKNRGVYLYWELPEALRKNKPNAASNIYPVVPNRWVVIRSNGSGTSRSFKGWIIESDYLGQTNGTSPYIHHSTGKVTNIGRKISLDDTWSEGASDDLFLTAIGTGYPTFSAYQPDIENVFSIHDNLSDGVDSTDTLSYYVIGWYSNSNDDFLSSLYGCSNFGDLLKELNWSVDNTSDTASTSVYQGVSCNIPWDKHGNIPSSDISQEKADIKLSIGNNSFDALMAMLNNDNTGSEYNLELLEAFQYHQLSKLTEPNATNIIDREKRNSWFGSEHGDLSWHIVDKSESDSQSTTSTTISPAELEKEATWLAELNTNQTTLAQEKTKLVELQKELYNLYWKYEVLKGVDGWKHKYEKIDFEYQLDPSNTAPASLAYQVQEQIQTVTAAASSSKIPQGNSAEEFATSIANYASGKGISTNRVLKPKANPRYWNSHDPVVLLTGTKNTHKVDDGNKVTCRFSDEIITSFKTNSTTNTISTLGISLPSTTNLSTTVVQLIQECVVLDPCNADYIASLIGTGTTGAEVTAAFQDTSDYSGKLPALDFSNPWTQPWLPLFLEWEVTWHPLDFKSDPSAFSENWIFNGTDYEWNGVKPSKKKKSHYLGRSILTTQNQFYLKKSLKTYLKNHPNADLKSIEQWIKGIDDWDFLSQRLSGLRAQLGGRDLRMYSKPPTSEAATPLIEATGGYGHQTPYVAPNPSSSHFHNLTAGQFFIKRMTLVDRFGQGLEIVENEKASRSSKSYKTYKQFPRKH